MAKAADRIPSWFVFDSREGGRLPAIAMPEGDPADHLAAGTWVQAPTRSRSWPTTLAPADLAATVERFNGFCETGVDEDFGRGDDEYDTFFAGGDGPQQGARRRRPGRRSIAARFVLSDLGTKGGLVTDEPAGRCATTARSSPACTPPATRRRRRSAPLPRPRRPARHGDGVRLAAVQDILTPR